MRRAWAAVLLVALAGCSAAVVGTESPTVTPAPVQGEGTPVGGATAAPDAAIAPGLSVARVTDPFALADAHRSVLDGRPFTVVRRRTVRNDTSTLRTVQRTVNVGPNRSRYAVGQRSRTLPSYPVQSAADYVDVWVDETGAMYRIGREEPGYRYRADGRAADPVTDVTAHDRLVGVFSGLNWRVTAEDVDSVGKAYYVLRADRATDSSVLAVPQLLSDPRNVRARAVVTGDGRLRQYRIRYDASLGEQAVGVSHTLRFDRVDVTRVERPEWYDEALDATDRSETTPSPTPTGG
jgi:hypothetical protein